jgi:hypothetical protein
MYIEELNGEPVLKFKNTNGEIFRMVGQKEVEE